MANTTWKDVMREKHFLALLKNISHILFHPNPKVSVVLVCTGSTLKASLLPDKILDKINDFYFLTLQINSQKAWVKGHAKSIHSARSCPGTWVLGWNFTWVKCPVTGFKLQEKPSWRSLALGLPWGRFHCLFLQGATCASLGTFVVHLSQHKRWLQHWQSKQQICIQVPAQPKIIQIHMSYFQGYSLSWKNTLPSPFECMPPNQN